MIQAPGEFRGTNVQVCGLWPFVTGSSAPLVGVPVGQHLFTGQTVCCDPISWFQDAKFINNPSQGILGLPGYGKSSLIRRQLVGSVAFGRLPLVLGDLKPDYVDLISALDGQVIKLGRGVGYINVLDPGDVQSAALKLTGAARERLLAEAHGRRHTMMMLLVRIGRGEQPTEIEDRLLDEALRLVSERVTGRVPVIRDLLEVIETAPDRLRAAVRDRGEQSRYLDAAEPLLVSLGGLLGQGRLGELFSRESSEQMRRDRPVVFDLSRIDETDAALRSAALLACWSTGFASVRIAHDLADAGLEPRRHYDAVLDEEWKAMQGGEGMVDRIDSLTRINRTGGYSVTHCTHTLRDFDALSSVEERAKARGFYQRAGMLHLGALPPDEMELVAAITPLSRAEQALITSWPGSESLSDEGTGQQSGLGKFMVKVGRSPGIPYRVRLTNAELAVNDTNQRWHDRSRIQSLDTEAYT